MKRMLFILLAALLFLTQSAGAITLDNTNVHWTTGVHTAGINNDANDQAQMLRQLGLFLGTANGFELERKMNRAEAAVMLVRFLGAEEQVQTNNWHPFKDVEPWADKYVGWLYQNGLAKGVSTSIYGAAQDITLEQYAIFLSRAVAGHDDWQLSGTATVDEVQLWDKDNGFFTRAAAVGMATRALTLTCTKNKKGTCSMAQYLIDKGVFTPKQLLEAAWGVLPPEYKYLDEDGYIYHTIAGVIVGKTDIGGLQNMTGSDSSLPYFYAWTRDKYNTVLYQIDCKTMESTMIFSRPGISEWAYSYASTVSGQDYLFEYSLSAHTLNLLKCDNGHLTTILPNFKFYQNNVNPTLNQICFKSENAMLIAGVNQYYLVDKDGLSSFNYPEDTQVLGFDGISLVTQLVSKQEVIISCLHAADGKTVDYYSVAQDRLEEYYYRSIQHSAPDSGGYCYYGEAGLYFLDSASGRMKQITSRPTMDITTFRMDDRYIILTHAPGQRVQSNNHSGGNQIVIIDYDGAERFLLDNDPPHGISIAGFDQSAHGSAVSFYSAADAGMQRMNIYHYILLPSYDPASGSYNVKQAQIVVTGYDAGRPELERQNYQQDYMQKEQTRLDALGY